jgi:2-C-methyl-D-erythritol 4-phosphate cytidylyltransferase/2-C-methyl-D-erythritol 2,4-cyclodiphosphate synthase
MSSTNKSPNTKPDKADFKLWLVIAAAGSGRRYGDGVPKQFCTIGGASPIRRSVELFLNLDCIGGVICVIPPSCMEGYELALAGVGDARLAHPVIGGATRGASVWKGLQAIAIYEPQFVLIHDAARCFCSMDVIQNVIEAIRHGAEAVVPAIPPVDAVRAGRSVLKSDVRLVQTPQGFCFRTIYELYEKYHGREFDDDASLCDMDGVDVTIVDGDRRNVKLTYSSDVPWTFRTGFGFDVHKFARDPNKKLRLMGMEIQSQPGLEGVSDADVGIHSLVDAILGALGAGSIGEHFPPTDVRFKDADSTVFLTYCRDLLRQTNAQIVNIDATIVCESPQIAPYAPEMKRIIADCLWIMEAAVNIKGKTTEGLGFEGRGEGISAYSTVMIMVPNL